MPSQRLANSSGSAELRTEQRGELVDELAGTLTESYEQDELDFDYDELDKRINAIRRGTAVVIPWEEARREILPDR